MLGPPSVKYRKEGDFAVLSISNPPVNVSSFEIRKGLIDHLDHVRKNDLKGVIIIGEGKCFIAGSDIKEFDKAIPPPELPDVINALEDLTCPVVAAIHGVALGGGLELALGCDYRIASTDTRLGLPEVSLGMIPGAGGTQRLTTLTGQAIAIRLITTGIPIDATEALEVGLIDDISRNDLLEDALALLSNTRLDKRITLNLPINQSDPEDIEQAERVALLKNGSRENVQEAIRLIKKAGTRAAEELLDEERSVFQRLRSSSDAKALRYLFFSERQAATIENSLHINSKEVSSVAIIGAGTMGQGIARAFISHGFECTIVERNPHLLAKSMTEIKGSVKRRVERKRLTNQEAHTILQRLNGATDYQSISHCDLVIEAVFEELSLKIEVLENIEKHVDHQAIIASNTSYLDINEMGKHLKFPQRLVGLHFFNPADVMKLLEIIQTKQTSLQTVKTSLTLAKKLKKQPAIAQVSDGFIGNRIFAAYRHRAELLVLDGASPWQIDSIVKTLGFPMGPFEVADASGLDIAWAMRRNDPSICRDSIKYAPIADALCEKNRLGRKKNAGWYDYADGSPPGSISKTVDMIIDQIRQSEGSIDYTINAETIANQLMITMLNASLWVLEDRVASRPSDIDVVMANGYGFPRWLGGPIYWALQQDAMFIQKELDELRRVTGPKYRIGNSCLIFGEGREN